MSGARPAEQRNEKLMMFLRECLTMGCLRGFYYFELYSRGREELLITVTCGKDPVFPVTSGPNALASPIVGINHKARFKPLVEGKFPPASPSTRDAEQMRQDAVFLLGGYARYKCPFVWVRSNHTRLLYLKHQNLGAGDKQVTKDTPLDLRTTNDWKNGQVRAWDIIEEIVTATVLPPPKNPFKIDFAKLEQMDELERSLTAASLVNFLKRIHIRQSAYEEEVFNDIQTLLDMHFACMPELLVAAKYGDDYDGRGDESDDE
eukprot:TRINITY_DN12339_c0_g1_i1.p1 TRINITY_DN12339_c0_g1~~TRINITY_DN12339_c0_g1_i1.p1  ORF type:complete len:261 (-),score=76.05 TRINITY_DN12339_c0_g1_i1:391-1173(-)